MERTREKKEKVWSLIERLMGGAPKKNCVNEHRIFPNVDLESI